MKKLLTEVLGDIEYTVVGDVDITNIFIDDVCPDSRKVADGDMFVCVVGDMSDGHSYAEAAYKKGCRVFLCQRIPDGKIGDDAVFIITRDTRRAMASVCAAFYGYPAKKLRIIGITGTKGKTTVAYLIYQILISQGKNAAYIGSNGIEYDNTLYSSANTTPDSYVLHYYFEKMLVAGVEFVVMEVSSQSVFTYRISGIEFETVAFTNLAPDHIGKGEHPTFEHYKNCKRAVFYNYHAKNMVYNIDDEAAEYMVNPALDLYPISLHGRGVFNAEDIEIYKESGVLGIKFKMKSDSAEYETRVRSAGEFSAYNAMMAIVCAKLCGVNIADSVKALSSLSVSGRFECVDIFSDRTFVVDYAHNGFSLSNVITALRAYPHNRLICLLGSVGGRTVVRRRDLGNVASSMCDYCIITSDNPDNEDPYDIMRDIEQPFKKKGSCDYVMISDREEAIKYAVYISKPGDIVLLAGKGHENYQVIKGVRHSFSEKKILREAKKLYDKGSLKVKVEM